MLPEKFQDVQGALALGIIENTSIQNKAQILELANKALAPPSPEQQAMAKKMLDAQYQGAVAEAQSHIYKNQLMLAQRDKALADAQAALKKSDIDEAQLAVEVERIKNERADIATYQAQNMIALQKLKLDERALDQKDRDLDIKEKQANKPKPASN